MKNCLIAAVLIACAACGSPNVTQDAAPVAPVAPGVPASPMAQAPAYLPLAYSIAIDPTISADDTADIMTALDNWTGAVTAKLAAHIGPCDADICIAYGPANYTLTPFYYTAGPMAGQVAGATTAITGQFGECDYTRWGWGGSILLNVTGAVIGHETFIELIEHEVGHAMGLSHHEGNNVMNPIIQPYALSGDDTVQFYIVHSEVDPMNADVASSEGLL